MIGNLFSNLGRIPAPKFLSDEELKAERIAFHRARVSNGPARFSTVTNGQVRRAQERDQESQQDKQFKRSVKKHLRNQREASILRGQLQAAGILPYVSGIEPLEGARSRANNWLYAHFGEKGLETIEPKHVEAALNAAWKRYTDLTGLPYEPLERA